MHKRHGTYGGQSKQNEGRSGQSTENGGQLPKESGTPIREDKLASATRGGK